MALQLFCLFMALSTVLGIAPRYLKLCFQKSSALNRDFECVWLQWAWAYLKEPAGSNSIQAARVEFFELAWHQFRAWYSIIRHGAWRNECFFLVGFESRRMRAAAGKLMDW
ncbi:hypothetical protein IWZ01DRAFT_227958 [Phyllosticta capitalensis]